MKHDEWESAMRLARAEVEADVTDILDELAEHHDGDWAMQNAIDLIRLRCTAVFTSGDEEDDE